MARFFPDSDLYFFPPSVLLWWSEEARTVECDFCMHTLVDNSTGDTKKGSLDKTRINVSLDYDPCLFALSSVLWKREPLIFVQAV